MPDHARRTQILRARLAEAGLDAASVEPAGGGVVAVAGLATLTDGSRVFAKTLAAPDADLFPVEADGLRALARLGGRPNPGGPVRQRRPAGAPGDAAAPRRHHVLGAAGTHGRRPAHHHRPGPVRLAPQRLAGAAAAGQHLGRRRARLLRPAADPPLAARAAGGRGVDPADRRALERLCARLPELIPAHPASLTHRDFWAGNVLADRAGAPVLVDPAISYTWPEVALAMLWCSPPPPEAERFFAMYEEAARPADGWREWAPILQLREVLSVIAHGDDDWGAVGEVRKVIAPFRHAG